MLKVIRGAADRPTGTYLFVGSPGAGKSSAARVLAAALLCPQSCGECTTCRRVFKNLHPDVMILEPEGYTYPVELLRAAAAAATQTPIEAHHRVFIVEEADRIPERSQNALLKALEEPNASVVWILLSDAVDAFLPTVLSRCSIVDFPPVGEHTLIAQLQSRYSLPEAEAERYFASAHGDPDAIVRLIEQPEEADLRAQALKLVALEDLTVVHALQAAEAVMGLAGSARARVEREQAERMAELEEMSARQGLTAWKKRQAERDKRRLRRVENEAQLAFLYWLAAACRQMAVQDRGEIRRGTKFWVELMQRCLDAQLAIRSNANPALAVEAVLLRLAG